MRKRHLLAAAPDPAHVLLAQGMTPDPQQHKLLMSSVPRMMWTKDEVQRTSIEHASNMQSKRIEPATKTH